jgi:hypothetical protein
MRYEIEFFRYAGSADRTEVVRRHSGDFNNLDAAKAYGLGNTGAKDSPEEVDGFWVSQNGVVKSETIIKPPGTRNA